MSVDLKPYPAMKDSGVPWLGAVPEHWEVRRLGTSVHGCINGIWGNDPNGREDLPCVRVADFDRARLRVRLAKPTLRAVAPGERKRRLLKKSDLLLEKSGGGDLQPVGVVMLYDHDIEAVCSNFVARMPVSARCNSSYLTYLHSHLYAIRLNVRSIKQTTGIQNLDSSSYLGEPVAFPPLSEQAAIVRFLDHADRRIRRYIRAQQQLIALLEEQKQAFIHQAVTGQINVRTGKPYQAYKPSGVEWLGDVPAHWEIGRLKVKLRPIDCRSSSGTETLLSLRRDLGVVVYAEHFSRPPQGASLVGYKLVETGQLVVNRLQANNGLLFCSRLSGVVSPDYSVFTARSPVDMEYLGSLLRTITYKAHFRRESTGLGTGSAGFLRLYDDRLLETPVALPPLEDQRTLLVSLNEVTASLCRAIDRQHVGVTLLREYRTRLIADVVTGKLDVREAAARLPDEVEELEPLDEADALIDGEDEPTDALATAP